MRVGASQGPAIDYQVADWPGTYLRRRVVDYVILFQ